MAKYLVTAVLFFGSLIDFSKRGKRNNFKMDDNRNFVLILYKSAIDTLVCLIY